MRDVRDLTTTQLTRFLIVRDFVCPLWLATRVVVWATFLIAAGPFIENRYFPVLKNLEISRVQFVPMDGTRGAQICFDYMAEKARPAIGVKYIVEVYHDDYPFPAFRGLTHRDETPYGGVRANTPAGKIVSNGCVAVNDLHGKFSRIGLRLQIDWAVPNRPWIIRQEPIWIDYHKPN
jgi:hypothetical protein